MTLISRYLKLFFYFVSLILGITLVTFIVIHLTPGKPTTVGEFNLRITAEEQARLTSLYGLDKPILTQYWNWLKCVLTLNFGNSFKDNKPAIKKILERLPATLLLNISSLILILSGSVFLGVLSARYRDTFLDFAIRIIVFIGYSLPTFWLALVLMIFFGLKLGLLPISGLTSLNFSEMTTFQKIFDIIRHLILPVLVMSFTSLASITLYVRNNLLEVMNNLYVQFGRARGLSEKYLFIHYGLGNTLLPLVTILGLSLPSLVGGGFIFETIFSYPGIGRLGYEAIINRDYPVIMATTIMVAALTLIGNFLADLSYRLLDPRTRIQK